MGNQQNRPLDALDDVGHGKGFARAGHAKQSDPLVALFDPAGQLFNGLGLVAAKLERTVEFKILIAFFCHDRAYYNKQLR